MTASYPASVKVFTTFTDDVDVDSAENINEIHDEVVAIEDTLGDNPQLLHDNSHTYGTVGAVLDQLDTNKSPVTHTHSVLGALVVGLASGQSVGLAVNTVQGLNNGVPAVLLLQPSGGDVTIGNGLSQVTVQGSLTVTGQIVQSSSAETKTDIADLAATDVLLALRPVSFTDAMGRHRCGLIAEEVAEVAPDLAVGGGVDYIGLTPLLIHTIQTLTARVQSLEERLHATN